MRSLGLALISLSWATSRSAALDASLFTAYYLFVAVVLLVARRSRAQQDFLAPLPGLLVLFYLYAIAGGLYVEKFGCTDHGFPVDTLLLSRYYATNLSGLWGLSVAFLLAPVVPRAQTITPASQADQLFYRRTLLVGPVLAACFYRWVLPNFNFLTIRSYAEKALADRVLYQSSAESGLVEVFCNFVPTTCLLWTGTLLMLRSRHPLAILAGAAIVGSYAVTQMLGGTRYYVVAGLLIPVIFWHFRRRSFRWLEIALLSSLTYIVINTLPVVRHLNEPREMLNYLEQTVDRQGLQFLRPELSGELLTSTNLIREMAGLDNLETRYLYGWAVTNELVIFIPRAFLPQRPLPISERFVDTFYPGIREAGGGFGLFFLQEGYWAAGEGGVFLSMLIYCGILQGLFWRLRPHLETDQGALLYSGAYLSLVASAVRTGMVLSFKAALMILLPALVIQTLGRLMGVKS